MSQSTICLDVERFGRPLRVQDFELGFRASFSDSRAQGSWSAAAVFYGYA